MNVDFIIFLVKILRLNFLLRSNEYLDRFTDENDEWESLTLKDHDLTLIISYVLRA